LRPRVTDPSGINGTTETPRPASTIRTTISVVVILVRGSDAQIDIRIAEQRCFHLGFRSRGKANANARMRRVKTADGINEHIKDQVFRRGHVGFTRASHAKQFPHLSSAIEKSPGMRQECLAMRSERRTQPAAPALVVQLDA